jgi:hypothetical protein
MRIAIQRHSADDLFGGPQGSPRTDKRVAAAIQWAERIMRKIDSVFGSRVSAVSSCCWLDVLTMTLIDLVRPWREVRPPIQTDLLTPKVAGP